jgi:hypothetical protein
VEVTDLERIGLWVAIITGAVGAVANIVQTLLQMWMLRELGDLDKDRRDWWERLEDSEQYKGVTRWLRFALGRPGKG